ncbi:MAG: hypothetical protein H6673_15590 [Anaerolineales bacterium]|nr:hypothetical protein [Anaerolineales bacterium]
MLHILQLIWDDWNVEHIAQHDITPQEVEEVCASEHIMLETYGYRVMIVGLTTAQRFVSVVLAPKEHGVYYPVTARPSSRRERQYYSEQKGGVVV